MLFEILNPSDACTLEADDYEVACVACLLLGEGMHGIREIGGDREMPILAFFGEDAVDTWFMERFGRSLRESGNACMTTKAPTLIACLDDVVLGDAGDRECYKAAVAAISGETERAKFRATWHDKHRSSLNDICTAAWSLAHRLRIASESTSAPEGGPAVDITDEQATMMSEILDKEPGFHQVKPINQQEAGAPDETDVLTRLRTVKTMPELDAMRAEVVQAIHATGTEEAFDRLQGAFIAAKNRLQRIPCSERTW